MTRWLAALALALPLAYAPPAAAQERYRCAVKDLSAAEQALVEQELAALDAVSGDTSLSAPRETITIPVHWHVITRSDGRANVSSLVPAQMAVLNAAYQRAGFQFAVASLEVVATDPWFFAASGSVEEFAMKAALRKGGPGDLNVYTTNGDVYLGWATFPIWYPRYSSYDGVVLWWAALPGTGLGGASADEPDGWLTYDQGDTATHEVGHWLGLYHTFQGGCSEPGDAIKSTPAEAAPQFYCAPRDSCGGKKWPGLDPITNYMDYVDDVCMDNFTAEQERRMYKQWKAFRRR
jgi:hypothetical protein